MIKDLFKRIKFLRGVDKLFLISAALLIIAAKADARICFLPTRCVGDTVIAAQNPQCLGYNLSAPKCAGLPCEIGWDCESCTNTQGVHYKCTAKPTPVGYTPGLKNCQTSCEAYVYSGFTGNQINGKCVPLTGYSTATPEHCTTYKTPEYTYGVEIGTEITEKKRSNCYANVMPLVGGTYTTDVPGASDKYCYTYDSQEGSDGERCYANAVQTEGTTDTRNTTSHVVETIYGVDRGQNKNAKTCYKAAECNTVKGWYSTDIITSAKYVYEEKTQDDITCRKPTDCVGKYLLSGTSCIPACSSNSDCADGQYCKITNYTTDGSCDTSNSNYFTSLKGTCTDLGTAKTATINGVSTTYSSTGYFNWWSAYNWCAARGLRLWTRDELSCDNLTGTTSRYYCCMSGKSCSDTASSQSTTMQVLRGLYSSDRVYYMWFNDSYGTNLGQNSCSAFGASLNSGYVYDHPRYSKNDNYGYPVCHGACGADYKLTSCPANASCSKCSSDGTAVNMKYKLDSCEEGYTQSGDTCVKTCSSNSDCADGQYCKITNYTTDGSCDTSNSNYFTSLKGTCTDLGTAKTATINGVSTTYSSTGYFNWWSAYNWCAARGLRLWTRDELSCDNLTGTTSRYYCCMSGKSCSDTASSQSTTMQVLRGLYSSDRVYYMWFNDSYGTNLGQNSCSAFGASLNSGYVYDHPRYSKNDNYGYPVCHGACGADYKLTSCPANASCSKCSSDGTAVNMKYKLDSCEEGYTQSGDTCVKTCSSNSDCADGQYCKITNYTTDGSCDTSNSNYFTSLKGTCTALGTKKTATINGVAVKYSSTGYNWWSAYNWCAAQGLRLWTRAELGCSNLTGTTSTGYCCMSGTSCSSTASTQSTTMQVLRGLYSSDRVYYMWLNDSYGTNLGQNSCGAFLAYLNDGYVDGNDRDYNHYYAVCR